jgi:hypothetical protein
MIGHTDPNHDRTRGSAIKGDLTIFLFSSNEISFISQYILARSSMQPGSPLAAVRGTPNLASLHKRAGFLRLDARQVLPTRTTRSYFAAPVHPWNHSHRPRVSTQASQDVANRDGPPEIEPSCALRFGAVNMADDDHRTVASEPLTGFQHLLQYLRAAQRHRVGARPKEDDVVCV